MKIAVFFELDGGGARRGANEFAKALKLKGHTVDLFCVDTQIRENERAYYTHIFLYPFKPVVWSGHDWKSRLQRDTLELVALYRLHTQIANRIEKEKYDFIFVQPSKFTQAPFILSIIKIPKLYYCQEPLRLIYDPLFAIPKGLHPVKNVYEQITRAIRKRIDAYNLKNASIVFANSNYTKANIFRSYGSTATVCHMGVDTARFYPSAKKSVDILFIGSRDFFDGYPLFEESVALMKQKSKIHYLIRGENWASNDTQLRRFYSRANSVICFGFHEPFGLIPLEAMACGATVVALDEGGYKDSIVHGKTGILVKRNPRQIAKTLDATLRNKIQLAALQKRAIASVREYWSWGRGAQQILSAFQELKNIDSSFTNQIDIWKSGFILYALSVISILMLFRVGFRSIRSYFPVPPIERGIVGYAQFFGYPLSFETYYFGFMFLVPIILAFCFRIFLGKRRI